jgi:glycosyltransferase involved in cell wall biosynthesis
MVAYTSYETDGRVRMEAEALVKWGYDVSFLVLKRGRQPQRYILGGVDIVELDVQKYRGKNKLRYLLSYLHFIVLAFLRCTALFCRCGMDVVHVHNMPDVLVFAALIPRLFGCKVVLDIHDTIPETYAAKFTGRSKALFKILSLEESLSGTFAHRIIAVNHVQRDAIIARGFDYRKVSTVITMPAFAGRRQHSIDDHRPPAFRVVNHGTVSKRLGIDLLVRAATHMAERIPGFELHIIGGGDDLVEVMRLSDTLGISECIHYHPAVQWDKLPEQLCNMDVGIVANRANICTHLMLPSKLIDYVSLNIPVVVPKLRAIEYYFTPDMASYFEPENIQSMAAAVIYLYKSTECRRQQAINARRFLDTYNWTTNSDLRDLYAELFASRLSRVNT